MHSGITISKTTSEADKIIVIKEPFLCSRRLFISVLIMRFPYKKRTVKSVGFENSPFAGNRNRTGTAFKLPRDFKSLVSTYSTIPADFFVL